MIIIATILLGIILILVIIDLLFLNKIKGQLKAINKTSVDEKYFELKYHLSLLKSISAILFFALGIIGYSSFQDIKGELDLALMDIPPQSLPLLRANVYHRFRSNVYH